MKRTNKVRLTESQLHRVIKESVKNVLNEAEFSVYNKLRNSSLSKQMSERDPEAYEITSQAEDLKDKISNLKNSYSGSVIREYYCELAYRSMENVVS